MASLYDTDFYAWTQEQSAKLRELFADQANLRLDFENLAEEIDSMGRSNRRELVNRLMQLDEHLMKLAFSLAWEPRRQWKKSVAGQRFSIAKLLNKNASLRRELSEALAEAHEDALAMFDNDKLIELTMDELPGLCPFELDDVLDSNWWPEPRGAQ